MADDPEAEAEDGEAAEEEGGGGKKKKKLIIIGAAALLLLGGGGGAAFFLMGGEPEPPAAAAAEDEAAEGAVVAEVIYHTMPTLQVNLAGSSKRNTYLRVTATLELTNAADAEMARTKSANIVDGFQALLRELRPYDISGSGGLMRVKEEMLARANAAMGKNAVKNVLLTEFLVQ